MQTTIRGKVIQGMGYGRKIGYPTANLDRRSYAQRKLKVPEGIYAGTARILSGSRVYKAAIVIGPRDRKGLPRLEAHLIGFSGNLYGKRLELILHNYLRAFKTFTNEASLKEAIQKDIDRVQKVKLPRYEVS